MGVDIHFFVETLRNGYWDVEAEFFRLGGSEIMSLISPYGIRGGDTAGLSKAGFPKEVSRKIVGKWGTWDKGKAGYPPNWGNVEPFKDSYLGKVYPLFGTFGEGWMTTEDFENIIELCDTFYGEHGIPGTYYSALSYMRTLESKGIPCRAVFFFDN
jgi:hypothetical protein